MSSFQLDENLNSRKLCSDCAAEGQCRPYRYPRRLLGLKDHQVLPEIMKGTRTLLTNDLRMPDEHVVHIPPKNPGIVCLGNSERVLETTTERRIRQILTKFKKTFPDWHEARWGNSIVRITESYVTVSHISDGQIRPDVFLSYDALDIQEKLREALRINAAL